MNVTHMLAGTVVTLACLYLLAALVTHGRPFWTLWREMDSWLPREPQVRRDDAADRDARTWREFLSSVEQAEATVVHVKGRAQ